MRYNKDGDNMKRLNKKGFAVSTMLYSLLILLSLVLMLILATMSSRVNRNNDFIDKVKEELNTCTNDGSC